MDFNLIFLIPVLTEYIILEGCLSFIAEYLRFDLYINKFLIDYNI